MDANVNQTPIVYVGTYTNTGSEGIYAYRFDRATGALEFTGNTAGLGGGGCILRFNQSADVTVLQNVFTGNRSVTNQTR